MTLLIMAAGMGSRFGGLKQIEPVGPNGEIIIDYSIYDAILAGFTKVVFVIKEENYELFKEVIGNKISKKVEVAYVFQKNDNILELTGIELERVKPFGTAHAILCAKDEINENFAIINSDDYYGRDAFLKIAEFLKNNQNSNHYAMVGYQIANTITENGSVKRGICYMNGPELVGLKECSVENINDKYVATPLNGGDSFEIPSNQLVSMNMFGFTPEIFAYLESRLKTFMEENKNQLDKCEYLIPEVVCEQIRNNQVTVDVLSTTSVWHGITYKEDKELVVKAIKELIDNNVYPNKI